MGRRADEKGDAGGALLYPTLMFRVNGVDAARAGEAWRTIPELMDEAEAAGEFRFPRRGAIVRPQKHATEWRVNVTQLQNADGSAIDGTDARSLTAGEIEGRRQARRLPALPARPGARLRDAPTSLDIAPQLGIRETRRLVGELRADAATTCSAAPTSTTRSASTAGRSSCTSPAMSSGAGREIPSRAASTSCPTGCCVPAGASNNLLVAGRCASMTHEGHSAARVTGACFVMGQAAGTAADLALKSDVRAATSTSPTSNNDSKPTGHYLGNAW